jgi:hypothetical protein
MKHIKHPLQIGQYEDDKWANHIDKKQNDIERKIEVHMM